MIKTLFLLFSIFALPLCSDEVVVRDPSGESFIVEVSQEDRFVDTVQLLQSHFGSKNEYVIDFQMKKVAYDASKKSSQPKRDYYAEVTPEERETIRYVILTLGNQGLAKITGEKKNLEKAKKKIYHVHPLRFLMTIFTEEDLKAAVASMDGRTFVWSGFMNGNKESLEKESDRNNVRHEMVVDFANRIGIDPDVIWPSIINRQWDQFVSLLLKRVPRAGNPDGINL